MKHFTIPPFLSHLPVDKRGYPIPFFVGTVDGEPEFRYLNATKHDLIINKKLCPICGKKLPKDFFYFISGPQGMKNRTSSDGPMHRECAEFSLIACPHLYLQKSQRRENDPLGKNMARNNKVIIKEKPTELFLVKSDKYVVLDFQGISYLRFRLVDNERYEYKAGILVKSE